MTLLPGFRLVVAPHFHLAIDWPGRLSLGAPVEQSAQGLVARPPWQPASADELAVLILDPTRTTARAELSGCLCLLVLPVHLRAAFWDLLARAPESGVVPAEAGDQSGRSGPVGADQPGRGRRLGGVPERARR